MVNREIAILSVAAGTRKIARRNDDYDEEPTIEVISQWQGKDGGWNDCAYSETFTAVNLREMLGIIEGPQSALSDQ